MPPPVVFMAAAKLSAVKNFPNAMAFRPASDDKSSRFASGMITRLEVREPSRKPGNKSYHLSMPDKLCNGQNLVSGHRILFDIWLSAKL